MRTVTRRAKRTISLDSWWFEVYIYREDTFHVNSVEVSLGSFGTLWQNSDVHVSVDISTADIKRNVKVHGPIVLSLFSEGAEVTVVNPGGGTIYVRWGRTTCPDDVDTELVYSGKYTAESRDGYNSNKMLIQHSYIQNFFQTNLLSVVLKPHLNIINYFTLRYQGNSPSEWTRLLI